MQQKQWQVLPEIKKDFIEKFPEYSRVVLQLLFNRGLKEKDKIEEFLNPDYGRDLFDPFLFSNMKAAVDLIIEHIKGQDKIMVYGDYDADGVTAAAVMYEALVTLKSKVDIYIPYRISEGYGLNKEAVKKIFDMGTKLIITVDGGIRNKAEVAYARHLGMNVIITDHHVAPENKEDLPDCLIINPMVQGEKYPFKFLAGVGVAFKLAMVLISKSTLSEIDKQGLEEKLFDLVPIGTVADCVSLLGENRILVKKGLVILNKTKRLGLKKLIEAARLNLIKGIDAWNIGWQIAPRLNAAGRIGHANTAFELLTTKEIIEAENLARRLNDRNIERQRITDKIVEEVTKQINEEDRIIIGVCSSASKEEAWHEGVVGLVAGRICEKYYRPTLVITRSGDEYKGSGRSIEELNIIKVIEEVGDLLERYGGHVRACGFSLKKKNLENFTKKVKQIVEYKLKGISLTPKLKIETELSLEEIDESLVGEVNKLSPFGQGNERPKFVGFNIEIVDIMNMGVDGQHIKIRIKSQDSAVLSAIGFGQAEKWNNLKISDMIDMVYYLEMNEFNGRREIQLKIVDIKKHATK